MKLQLWHFFLICAILGAECAWLDSHYGGLFPWYFGSGLMGFIGQGMIMLLWKRAEKLL